MVATVPRSGSFCKRSQASFWRTGAVSGFPSAFIPIGLIPYMAANQTENIDQQPSFAGILLLTITGSIRKRGFWVPKAIPKETRLFGHAWKVAPGQSLLPLSSEFTKTLKDLTFSEADNEIPGRNESREVGGCFRIKPCKLGSEFVLVFSFHSSVNLLKRRKRCCITVTATHCAATCFRVVGCAQRPNRQPRFLDHEPRPWLFLLLELLKRMSVLG